MLIAMSLRLHRLYFSTTSVVILFGDISSTTLPSDKLTSFFALFKLTEVYPISIDNNNYYLVITLIDGNF